MNKSFFTGRTTADPDVRYTQEKMAIAKVSLAVDDGFGEKKSTSFFNLTAFGKTAESMGKYVKKGTKIAVVCRAKQDTWTDKEGQKRSSVGFIVESWEFAQSAGEAGETKSSAPEAPAEEAQEWIQVPEGIQEELPFN